MKTSFILATAFSIALPCTALATDLDADTRSDLGNTSVERNVGSSGDSMSTGNMISSEPAGATGSVGSSAGSLSGSGSLDSSRSINSSARTISHTGSYDWTYSTAYSDGGPSGGSLSRDARF